MEEKKLRRPAILSRHATSDKYSVCAQENFLLNKKKILIKWEFSASGLRSRAYYNKKGNYCFYNFPEFPVISRTSGNFGNWSL